MSEKSKDLLDETSVNEITNSSEETTLQEPVETMEDYKDELNKSLRKIYVGDILKGVVIGVSDTEVIVDLGYYAEGIIPIAELSNDPRFSIKQDILVGDNVSATVIKMDNGEGNILLSKKRADDILAWNSLKELMINKTPVNIKISQAVNGGVTTYIKGIRGFIPASQLSLNYVENLTDWVNKEISVLVITVDEENKKVVLSGKEIEKDKAEKDKKQKISQIETGIVVEGVVEKIAPYGAFIAIPNNLSGLLHISQISNKRLKSPNEVLKLGQTINVKITEVKDGKISLSLKAVLEEEEVSSQIEEVPVEYSSSENAGTSLANLLANFKIK